MSPIRPTVQVVGRRLDPEHHRLRDFLTRTAQPHDWLEAGSPEAVDLLAGLDLRDPELPVVVDGDDVHIAVTVERLAEAGASGASRAVRTTTSRLSGPARPASPRPCTRHRTASRRIVCDRDVPGGQASHTSLIENFFGFPDGIGGAELARMAGRQAEQFGAELMLLGGISGSRGDGEGDRTTLLLDAGGELTATVVLAATGMDWRRLELEGVDELLGRGVYYGAGRSEARHCRGDEVVVVGAGNSAGQAVINLAGAGARVTMAVRGSRLEARMSAYLVERIRREARIDVRLGTQVTGLGATAGRLTEVTLTNSDGVEEHRPARALFLCLGGLPHTGWCPAEGVRTDAAGYIVTGTDLLEGGSRPDGWPLERDPFPLETSRAGLFAAGDVRHGSTKRVAGAVGEGAMAVALAHRRLAELGRLPAGG